MLSIFFLNFLGVALAAPTAIPTLDLRGDLPIPYAIHPDPDSLNFCLDVAGGVLADGTPVQMAMCNGSPGQRWKMDYGARTGDGTRIAAWGTNFCLDVGSNPKEGDILKIWTCYKNLPAQTFWVKADSNAFQIPTTLGTNFGPGARWDKMMCLDRPGNNYYDGTMVRQAQCQDSASQSWWASTDWWETSLNYNELPIATDKRKDHNFGYELAWLDYHFP